MVALRAFFAAGLLLLGSIPNAAADTSGLRIRDEKPADQPAPPPPPPPQDKPTSKDPPPTTIPSTTSSTTTSPPALPSTSTPDKEKQKHTKTTSINPIFAPSNVPVFAANGTYNAASGALPVTPAVTPALGLAGVILLVTGVLFAVIGVRRRRIFIFLSTTFLTALSVVVLIVYVAVPPISEAVQGAYFVAAFLSGCILGGLSLIFTEVTQGLGCLLGGFCVSMWFMVLKPGGLITSEIPRIIFISAMTGGGFALSFSHYTRDYALIGLISFSGATAAILGIDCFSRAGLKEFWIYSWHLNEKLFPLGTHTYPMTKGIKVEIAGTLILTFMGLLSQIKLWKILEEKQRQRKLAQMQDQEDREHLDMKVGRKLEDENAKDRAHWEMEYGNDKYAGSTLGSTSHSANNSRPVSLKPSGSLHAPSFGEPFAMEMRDMNRQNKRASQSSVSGWQNGKADKAQVTVNELELNNNSREMIPEEPEWFHPDMPSWPLRQNSNGQYLMHGEVSEDLQNQTLQPSARPPPVVVPLPFQIPNRQPDDTRSMATVGETVRDPFADNQLARERRPLNRTMPAKSTAGSRHQEFSDFDDFDQGSFVPHIDDDKSSVAATLDEINSDAESAANSSREASPVRRRDSRMSRASLRKSTIRRVGSATNMKDVPEQLDEPLEPIKGHKRRSSAPTEQELLDRFFGEDEKNFALEPAKTLGLSTIPKDDEQPRRHRSKRGHSRSSIGSEVSAGGKSLNAANKKNLPSELPKVALYYRTNEWAKHLEAAEKPDNEELLPTEAGVSISHNAPEPTAPVDVDELQQVTTSFHLRTGSKNSSRNSNNPFRKFSFESQPMQKGSTPSQPLSNLPNPNNNANRRSLSNPSIPGSSSQLHRSSTQPALHSQVVRSTSTPLTAQPLVESPVEEIAAGAPTRPGLPASSSQATLLHKREDLMRNKLSTTSLMGATPPMQYQHTNASGPLQSYDSGSMYNLQVNDDQSDNISLSSRRKQLVNDGADDENMPLSQRRQAIQSQQFANSPYQSQRPQSTWPAPGGGGAAASSYASLPRITANTAAVYDSHQPQRGNQQDPYVKHVQLANWREHVRQDLVGGPAQQVRHAADQGRRLAMLEEKRMNQMAQQQREWNAAVRDTVFDQRMRNGEMLDLHQQAMKKMQQKAPAKQ